MDFSGALLALVGRNADKFDIVVERIKENGVDLEPLVIIGDVSIDAARIIDETIERYGHLDIVINNAGFALQSTLEHIKLDEYDLIFGTVLRGAIELTKLAVPYLTETKGNVINISSSASLSAVPIFTAYSMAKYCLDHFTKCMYSEFE